MYINGGRTYYDGGEQHASRGDFLILVTCEEHIRREDGRLDIRALVRTVALHQFGHWMMGSARAFGESICISGSYGNDGLPRTVSEAIWNRAIQVPSDLVDLWNNGGGHNNSGSESTAMRKWALANLPLLKPNSR